MDRDPCELRRYLITDSRAGSVDRLTEICERALRGGMTAIQLRVRGWSDRACFDAALRLRDVTSRYGVPLIVNDRIDIALASSADGVHLGVDDLPVREARRMLGPGAWIGYSPEGGDDAVRAIGDGATYLGIGPVFGTHTKSDAGAPIGLAGIQTIAQATDVPVVGVGGITVANAASVVTAGALGVALVGAVFLADDPELEARRLTRAVP